MNQTAHQRDSAQEAFKIASNYTQDPVKYSKQLNSWLEEDPQQMDSHTLTNLLSAVQYSFFTNERAAKPARVIKFIITALQGDITSITQAENLLWALIDEPEYKEVLRKNCIALQSVADPELRDEITQFEG